MSNIKNTATKKTVKDIRNTIPLNSILAKPERGYYEYKLNTNKGDLSKSWRVLKEIIDSKKESTKVNIFCFGNREVTEEFEIANLFNNYFVNIGPT